MAAGVHRFWLAPRGLLPRLCAPPPLPPFEALLRYDDDPPRGLTSGGGGDAGGSGFGSGAAAAVGVAAILVLSAGRGVETPRARR